MDKSYDEDAQAKYIERYCRFLNRAKIHGFYYNNYRDNWDLGYSLVNGMKRKKSFYIYKSYEIKRL